MAAKKPAKKRVASWVVTDDFRARVKPLAPVRERLTGVEYTRKRVADASRSQRAWCGR